ncbi:MAG: outer membrane lipoprotein carrier protein LolA [Endomicrobium sp.]|jgi:outer membrane lipoprotein-sorting protein|nr:outer membrane lipoprotein carrier protein LolA [Endomicrobium sp.]
MSNDKLNTLLLKIEKINKGIKTLKVDYMQTVVFEATKERKMTIGTLFFKKPDSIHINQRTPQIQKIYINGENITVYTPDNKQVIIDKWENVIDVDFAPANIVNFGNSWRKIKKTNIISFDGENKKYIVFKIISFKKNKDWYIKIYVSKATMYPEEAVMESDGVAMRIVFKNYAVDHVLDKNIFRLNIPNDVEVIKLN